MGIGRWSKSALGKSKARLGEGSLGIRCGSQADILQPAFPQQVQGSLFSQAALYLQEEEDLAPGIKPSISVENFEHRLQSAQDLAVRVELPARKPCRPEAFQIGEPWGRERGKTRGAP